jgi:hypothetical protein
LGLFHDGRQPGPAGSCMNATGKFLAIVRASMESRRGGSERLEEQITEFL